MQDVVDILVKVGRLVREAKRLASEARLEDMMGMTEVAKLMGLSRWTVRQMMTRGELQHYLIGTRYRFKPSDVEKYLASCRVIDKTGRETP